MKSKTILVTGGAGHVGSHVIEELIGRGEPGVISLDNYFNGSEANHITGADYRRGHTKDIDAMVPEIPDIIYHLGEYARIKSSWQDIRLVHDMNPGLRKDPTLSAVVDSGESFPEIGAEDPKRRLTHDAPMASSRTTRHLEPGPLERRARSARVELRCHDGDPARWWQQSSDRHRLVVR